MSLFFISVFVAGILSFFSPCIFPLLPVYIGQLLNQDERYQKRFLNYSFNWYSLLKTIIFLAGISIVFVSLGYGAGLIGNFFYHPAMTIIFGLLVIILGLHQADFIRLKPLYFQRNLNFKKRVAHGELIEAFLLGLSFSFGWTPCIGPILSSVLALAASGGNGALQGGFYMFLYTLGLAIPFLILALMSSVIMNHFQKIKSYLPLLKKIGGVLIIIMGVLLMLGKLHQLV